MPTSLINAPLDWKDIRNRAAKFSMDYKKAKSEESDKQLFWHDFFDIFGIPIREVGVFEDHVKKIDGSEGKIDYFWPGKLIIEHKSRGKDLNEAYQQALDYTVNLNPSEYPSYFIVSDFANIWLFNKDNNSEYKIKLSELADNIELFGFIAGYGDKEIVGQHPVNIKAAEKMGKLYDLLKNANYPSEFIDKYLIRLVFCLFAEDSGIFQKNIFQDYIRTYSVADGTNVGSIIDSIFDVLNTPVERRQKSMDSKLSNFPFVNGGLFAERLPMAYFDREMRDYLLSCAELDWKKISPAIFGSLFQSIMDPEMRRKLGAHYTSEENILKVINPLFMDDLRSEFEKIKKNKNELRKFWDKISKIKILDPACGCGNFLIISYRELRFLEMDVLDALYEKQMILDESHLYVNHFYGIEIGKFPSQIANLSMILMDHLMNMEMTKRFGQSRNVIPLKDKANIVCSNSISFDWNDLISSNQLTFIIGNPPFCGYSFQTNEQKNDVLSIFTDSNDRPIKTAGKIDYVACWFAKACEYIHNSSIRVAFVSTNSIVQGEQVSYIWQYLFDKYNIKIDFAYRTFIWSNEAKGVAAVHCVIISFSNCYSRDRYIFDNGVKNKVNNITPYLTGGTTIFLPSRNKPISYCPDMITGNRPADGGNLIIEDEDLAGFIEKDPISKKYIRPFLGSDEFINGRKRWCIWLKNVSPSDFNSCPEIVKRIKACKEDREKGASDRQKLAKTPYLFREQFDSDKDYVVIPATSSENRDYIPIGYVDKNVICSNSMLLIPDARLYHFAILTSHIHMVWVSYVCGRLKSDYRYSRNIVYNNYPWPKYNLDSCVKIESLANNILIIRSKYSNQTLADLYNPLFMPKDLVDAHASLDKEVEKLYRKEPFKNDDERISFLFELYSKLN